MKMRGKRLKRLSPPMNRIRGCSCCGWDGDIDRAFEKREWQDEVQEEMTDR